jgi:hypothetical protein
MGDLMNIEVSRQADKTREFRSYESLWSSFSSLWNNAPSSVGVWGVFSSFSFSFAPLHWASFPIEGEGSFGGKTSASIEPSSEHCC